MPCTDDDLKRLEAEAEEDIQKQHGLRMFGEELVSLITRLQAAERLIPKPAIYDAQVPCKRAIEDGECKDCELYAAWRRTAGK